MPVASQFRFFCELFPLFHPLIMHRVLLNASSAHVLMMHHRGLDILKFCGASAMLFIRLSAAKTVSGAVETNGGMYRKQSGENNSNLLFYCSSLINSQGHFPQLPGIELSLGEINIPGEEVIPAHKLLIKPQPACVALGLGTNFKRC